MYGKARKGSLSAHLKDEGSSEWFSLVISGWIWAVRAHLVFVLCRGSVFPTSRTGGFSIEKTYKGHSPEPPILVFRGSVFRGGF
jgi:hypothetical protein